MKVAVIGAGPAGMTAAYELSKNKIKVDVFESSGSVGGLAKTITLWDQKVDIGPHRFFSTDKRVNALWLELAGNDYQIINRLTRIYYKKKFFVYPLNVFNAIKNLGIAEAARCVLSYLYQRNNDEDGSFQTWVQNRFGKRLFTIFFKNYSEKLWGIDCNDLDADFAAQRIKKLSMYEAVKNAILHGKGNKHKTLVDQFAYPSKGSGMIYERMADTVRSEDNNIFLNTPVYRIVTAGGKVQGIELENGVFRQYDVVISTMPFTLMVNRLLEAPQRIKELTSNLKFRNTIMVYLLVDAIDLFPDNWIYVHSPELKMGRITNFRNWVHGLYNDENKTILSIEYWCNDDDEIWSTGSKEITDLAKREIYHTTLVKDGLVEDAYVHKIPNSYPIYRKGYKDYLKPVEKFVASIENLSVIGRYGSFKYNNQDHSILMGLLASDNIINNANHILSEINTDFETYQESYIITKTGLQKQ